MPPLTLFKKHKIPTPYLVGPVDIFELQLGGKRILVDTGPQTFQAMNYLDQHLDLAHLDYLLLTHCHPDHYGLAAYIEQHSPATIIACRRDAALFARFDERIEFLLQQFQSMGFPPRLLRQFEGLIPRFQGEIPFVSNYLPLQEANGLLAELGLGWVSCPGHSQTDICYSFQDQVITGDVLLRNIFTAPLLDLDMEGQGRFKNYAAYCSSLPKMLGLAGKTLHPSHNDYIEDLEGQIRFYAAKVISRSKTLAPLMKQGRNEEEILLHLFPDLFAQNQYFKIYIKAGELRFFQDFVLEPQRLLQGLDGHEALQRDLQGEMQQAGIL